MPILRRERDLNPRLIDLQSITLPAELPRLETKRAHLNKFMFSVKYLIIGFFCLRCYAVIMKRWLRDIITLRWLAGFWGWITIFLFVVNFIKGDKYTVGITSAAIIYATILAMYAGSKEYQRWSRHHNFESRYFGEVYVAVWSLVMTAFVLIAIFSGNQYRIPGEFPATYLMVVSIFILSRESKALRHIH